VSQAASSSSDMKTNLLSWELERKGFPSRSQLRPKAQKLCSPPGENLSRHITFASLPPDAFTLEHAPRGEATSDNKIKGKIALSFLRGKQRVRKLIMQKWKLQI
jgi:hypothetical protein